MKEKKQFIRLELFPKRRVSLIVISVLQIAFLSFLEGREENNLGEKMLEIDYQIYEVKNYKISLQMCEEVLELGKIDTYYEGKAKNYINLIENYSDYDQKPLELFFKARRIRRKMLTEKDRRQEYWEELGNLYKELLNKYPHCKLAGFIQYLIAERNKSYSFRDEEERQTAIQGYREVVNRYPDAEFPIEDYPQYFRGLKIAPIAHIKIASLYEEFSHNIEPDLEQAIREYKDIIDKYPNELNRDGSKLILSAYVSMINIYSGLNIKEARVDSIKAKEHSKILINDFPNQSFLVSGPIRKYFGEIHPEAYMRLARFEVDKEKAIELYKKVLIDYPKSWTGAPYTCGISLYAFAALREIIELLDDSQLSIKECQGIINSNADKGVRALAQFLLGGIYEDMKNYDQARIEFQKVIDNYSDVDPTGGTCTLSDDAKNAIMYLQKKMLKK